MFEYTSPAAPASPRRRALFPFALFLTLLAALLPVLAPAPLRAQVPPIPTPAPTAADKGQTWDTETLSNGLRVIYAPMPTSPTVHVRVLYHVGSRDEQYDRQGFAHMFEHMMFRGSAHVAPQEHMKLIGLVGGISNAYTSFDETVYWQTLPASYSQLALWLEADRMSSFKVSQEIFATERQVVAEEWRMRLNQPYGGMFDELMPEIFKVHPYHWTPIGNMDDLRAANIGDIQAFFNKYYVPNNAILVIAGNIDLAKTKDQVHKYFGWIPEGNGAAGRVQSKNAPGSWIEAPRNIPTEPPQTAPRRLEVKMAAPLPRVLLAWRAPRSASDDMDALGVLLGVVGDGQSSRLFRALVTNDKPLAVNAGSFMEDLEDGGVMGYEATVLQGKNPADVEKIIRAEVAKVRDNPVSPEELEKVKQGERLNIAMRFETAQKVAEELGSNMLTYGNLDRVPTARARLEAITVQDLQRVAKKYFSDDGCTTMIVTPGTPPPAATQPITALMPKTVAPSTAPVAARTVNFPRDYPTTPPMSGKLPAATFEKGTETAVALPGSDAPVHLIVMEDHRTPTINMTFVLRAGSYATPIGKDGLGGYTSDMVRRGPKGKSFDQFNEDLESRAISFSVDDDGDSTRVTLSCLKEQFAYALNAAKSCLLTPAFDPEEFNHMKDQALSEFALSLNDAHTLADRAVTRSVFGESFLGRLPTLETLGGITLDDVKTYYNSVYKANDAVLMISGDISVPDAQRAGETFLTGMPTGALPKVDFSLPPASPERHILLIDRPESKQAAIDMGIRAFSIASDEKFAGTLASRILSSGIDSRLGQYVRAEKGYVYGVQGYFSPGRYAGEFLGETDTKFETAADTITAMFKVFDDMKATPVSDAELADSKFRVAGGLLMAMETIRDQASRRVDGILNHYPIDYYDKYAERVGTVTPADVKALMDKYVLEDKMTIVVVGPAATLKPQLEKLGPVEMVGPPITK